MLITRKAEFSASHICRDPRLSDAENRALYGAAANPHGHGHNYVLEVTVAGTPDPVTGMVLDLKALKDTLNREVAPFDHVMPTPENIAIDIWNRLQPHLSGPRGRLHGVRVYETPDLYVDYSGDAA